MTASFTPKISGPPTRDAEIDFSMGRETLNGEVVQNRRLTLKYDPARLPHIRTSRLGVPVWDTKGTIRFHPGLETFTASVVKNADRRDGTVVSVVDPPLAVPLQVTVPPDAMGVEMWFENSDIYGNRAWDSRYGQNYWRSVAQDGPARPVSYRTGATRDISMVNVLEWSATKVRRLLGHPPSQGSQIETQLSVRAWVRNLAYEKNVWLDLHVFDASGNVGRSLTMPFAYSESRADGDIFGFDQTVYVGSGGVPGAAWPRPDVRLIQFRLYYEVSGRVYSDGYLHQTALKEDGAVSESLAAAA